MKISLLFSMQTMRTTVLSFILITTGLFSVQANTADAQAMEERINVEFKQETLLSAIKKLESKSSAIFAYDQEYLGLKNKTVKDILFKNERMAVILEFLLKEYSISYQQQAGNILLNKKVKLVTITGKVTDEKGEPLPGVSVSVKGKQLQASSNSQGNYSLQVPDLNLTLVFHFIGYLRQEIKPTSGTIINISMQPDIQALNEVVVTALNIEKSERSLGYSIARLDGSKVNTVQTPNLINALSGKVAGVDIGNTANGVAGSKRVVIRGASSLTGNNQPLWIVDGIPINTTSLGGLASNTPEGGIDYGDGLTGINPDDIQSISVLKGNAAAALYGSRASNGVILITTKSGKSAKGKMNIDFSSSLLVDRLINHANFQNVYGQSAINQPNATDLPTSADNAKGSDNWGHKLDGTPTVQFDGVIRPFSAVKDNYERFFTTGSTINNTIALSGSSENQDYRVSLSDLRNTDIVPNANFARSSINTKAHSKFGKLDVDIVLNYIYEKANNRPYIGGNHDNQFYSLLYLPNSLDIESLKPGYDANGRELLYTQGVSNPYYIVNKEKEFDTRGRLTGSISLKYQFTNWLYTRGRFTRDNSLAKRFQYIPDGNASSSFPYNSPSNIGGILNQRAIDNAENNYELLIGVDPKLKGHFTVNGFIGGNINWRTGSQVITSGNTFTVPGVYTFNNLTTKLPSTSESRQRTNSLFGNVEFAYKQYLYLTLTGRNDWFSTLPMSNNNLFYPSAALSFVFTDAIKFPDAISYGKLRLSTAQVSGDTDPYQLDLSYALDALQYNSTVPLQTVATSNIPNRFLKPLLSKDYEIGMEMDFLSGRIGFDIAYYKRQIKDDIVQTAVSSATTYSTAVLNVGKMQNSGIEILLRGMPVKSGDFTWDMTATFSKNDNKVIALGNGVQGAPIQLATSKSGNASIQLEEGRRYAAIYGFTYMRDDQGRKVLDSRGFPLASPKAGFLGYGTYDKLLGFSNTFTYKNISLYTLVDGKFGAVIYSETNATAYKNGKHKATLIGREDGILAEGVNQQGQQNTVRVPAANINSYYNQVGSISEQFIYDASFLKLREVALRYKFPDKTFSKIGINSASVSLVARNLFTIYKDKNLDNVDPESNVASNNQQGIERMVYPATRNLGLTLKFGL
ncbi:SusC/RagA family TonB-linked outer membrane protein [Pedobacter foliorum]|uniref:SusC/RagA family TonB-linked outer membrane protein n=1 Tax=Pedobacter foliorum TaxID=2739058 RepID=UPI001567305C|nr:SusC/RagA family TonB-linked outer membrane protein [Pedobacter foliorum]NRF39529.1 SusC/RagA family TonB-linked outer membrane protein [Pedobacter foliorum]